MITLNRLVATLLFIVGVLSVGLNLYQGHELIELHSSLDALAKHHSQTSDDSRNATKSLIKLGGGATAKPSNWNKL